jgi:ferredoxin
MAERTHTVEFVVEGATVECGRDEYVLDAAHREGVDLAYGCLQGVCIICSARVEGDVHQPEAEFGWGATETEGYALLCVAYPRSDLRVWTGEEPH